jgi:hypothetical protein
VICHNKYGSARGWIRISAAALDKESGQMRQKSLGEALALPRTGYAIFTDCGTHLEHIRACGELWEKGFFAELEAYAHHVFVDWRFVDGEGWSAVCEAVGGGGVESVWRTYSGMMLDRVRRATYETDSATREKARAKKAPAKRAAAGKGRRVTSKGTPLGAGQAPAAKKTTKAAKPRTTKAAVAKRKSLTTKGTKGTVQAAKKRAAAGKAKGGGRRTP